ncbi:Ig-like domain-containing protein, partial [Dorea formicigenerans]|nr:Ig-like domain-containing protein [Dorea formicigenerans]
MTPSNGYNVFHWKSSNEEIVKVDADGTVTGIIPGEAVVTAIATDGTSLTVSAKVTVRKVIPVESIQLDPVDDI